MQKKIKTRRESSGPRTIAQSANGPRHTGATPPQKQAQARQSSSPKGGLHPNDRQKKVKPPRPKAAAGSRVGFWTSPDVVAFVDRIAAAEGKSREEFVREAVEEKLNQPKNVNEVTVRW